jgi:hypothetical protein
VFLLALLMASATPTEQQVRQAMKACRAPTTWLKHARNGRFYVDWPTEKFSQWKCILGHLPRQAEKKGYIGRPIP